MFIIYGWIHQNVRDDLNSFDLKLLPESGGVFKNGGVLLGVCYI